MLQGRATRKKDNAPRAAADSPRSVAQLVDSSQNLNHFRQPADRFKAVAGLAAPIGPLRHRARRVLRLGFEPQVFEVDEHQAAQDRGWKEASQRAVLEFLRQRGWLDAEQSDLAAIMRACVFEIASRDTGVVLINLEDLWLETESQNTPGTVAERPNWRRKARYNLETIRRLPEVVEVLRRVHELRNGPR